LDDEIIPRTAAELMGRLNLEESSKKTDPKMSPENKTESCIDQALLQRTGGFHIDEPDGRHGSAKADLSKDILKERSPKA